MSTVYNPRAGLHDANLRLSDFAGKGKLFNSKAIGDESDIDFYCAGVAWSDASNECEGISCETSSPYNTPVTWSAGTRDLTPYQAFESGTAMSFGDPSSNDTFFSPPFLDEMLREMPFVTVDGPTDMVGQLAYSTYPPFDEGYCARMNQFLGYSLRYTQYVRSINPHYYVSSNPPLRFRARQRNSVRKLREWTPKVAIALIVEQATRLVFFTLIYTLSESGRSSLWIQLFNRNLLTPFFWYFSGDWQKFRDEQVLPRHRKALLVQTLFDLFHSLIMVAWTATRLASMTYIYNKTYRPDRLLPLNYVLLVISAGMLFSGLYKVFAACCCSDDDEDEEVSGTVQPQAETAKPQVDLVKNVVVQPSKRHSESDIVKIEEMEMQPVTIHAEP